MKLLIVSLLLLLAASCTTKNICKCDQLFDGKTLDGWEITPGGKWEVKDGVIAGTSKKSEKRHSILLTKKQYSDFVMCLKYNAVKGNSGLYFRVNKIDHFVTVKGFQAEIGHEYETVSWQTSRRRHVCTLGQRLSRLA